MPDSFQTLTDLVKLNDRRNAEREISDILNQAPVLAALAADTCPETTHYYTKYTTAPTVGFRAANDGRENSKSGDTQVSVLLKILDGTFAVDVAIADAFKDGADAYIAKEGARHLQAAFFAAEQQMWYGQALGAAGGFVGFGDETDLDDSDDSNVVDATGSTADTGSSVWLIRTTGDNNGTAIIAGKNGNISVGDTSVVRVAGSSTGTFPAYYTPVTGWMGLQRGGKYSVIRIANLTEQNGKGLTDTLIARALEKFPATGMPTIIAGSKRSIMQLRNSRTATNATGAPAPIPTEAFGIPIITTDSISNTEAILTAGS